MNNKIITQYNERIKKENVQSIFILKVLKDDGPTTLIKVYTTDKNGEYQLSNNIDIQSIIPDKYLHFSVICYSTSNAEVYIRADTLIYFHINKQNNNFETAISALFQNKGCSVIGIYECNKFEYDLNSTADYNELSPDIRANIMELIV